MTDDVRSIYDPSLEVPADVLAAARLVSNYFAEQNVRGWKLHNCADRAHFCVDGNAWTPDEDRYTAVVRQFYSERADGRAVPEFAAFPKVTK